MVNVKWAMRVLLEDIRANNDVPAKALNQLLWKRYGVTKAQTTLYRVRTKTLVEIHGGHDVSYKELPRYYDVIKELNPNSLAFCAWNNVGPNRPMMFRSIFTAFKDVLDELSAECRSLIGVDGSDLKGNYGGGIDLAISEIWLKVGRRFCCKHLVKNFKKEFPGLLMFQLFWKAAGAYNPFTFKKAMKALQKANPLALVWLSKFGPQSRWSKHAFNPIVKCDSKFRPVLTFLEGIRRLTMVRMATRREACESRRDDVCPNIMKRLQVISHESRTCKCLKSGDGEFEVLDGKSVLPVNLRGSVCNAWQLSGLPCKHAMRAILYDNQDPRAYISEWYSASRYKLAYANSIKAIPDVEQWPESNYLDIAHQQ
ncbi:uncharacterized protein LOC110713496 [Chenopodium quinoa]|uniref:uncharacterized protein LOC110713496 n=1 Tax=Chenopodium quinoa TaxID=63459 RepID=UPI000B781EA2|nr:uncharacterized protein LOC110713496 [Chenopodium quinoa]